MGGRPFRELTMEAIPPDQASRAGALSRVAMIVIGGVFVATGLVAGLIVWVLFKYPKGMGAERLLGPIVGIVGLVLLAIGVAFIAMSFLSTDTLMGKGYANWRATGYFRASGKWGERSFRDRIEGEQFEAKEKRPTELH
jgi:hypothetical protein